MVVDTGYDIRQFRHLVGHFGSMCYFSNSLAEKRFFLLSVIFCFGCSRSCYSGTTSEILISKAFTQKYVFEELVIASEGVPRDAMIILGLTAERANENRISMNDIRNAARLCCIR